MPTSNDRKSTEAATTSGTSFFGGERNTHSDWAHSEKNKKNKRGWSAQLSVIVHGLNSSDETIYKQQSQVSRWSTLFYLLGLLDYDWSMLNASAGYDIYIYPSTQLDEEKALKPVTI